MNVGILGCGTIGGGVLNIIDNLPSECGMKVLKVFDLPSKKDALGERYASTIDESFTSFTSHTTISSPRRPP